MLQLRQHAPGSAELVLQEALANPKAAGNDEPSTRPGLPKDARVVTYYYDTPSLGQARIDCERSNGIWQTH